MVAADAVPFGWLLLISIAPVILQAVATLYLFKIRKYIGRNMTLLLGGINLTMFLRNVTITYGLLLAEQRVRETPIEAIGLLIGFAMPLVIAALMLVFQRRLASVFTGGGK